MVEGVRECTPSHSEQRSILKIYPVNVDTTNLETFVYNESFTVTKGKEFWIDNHPTFPGIDLPARDCDATYRTYFGPYAAHNGIVLANTDHNLKYGFRRMVATRKPYTCHHCFSTNTPGSVHCSQCGEEVTARGYDLLLQGKQLDYTADTSFFETESIKISQFMEAYQGTYEEARLHHTDPHPKLALRIQAWIELTEAGEGEDALWLKSVLYKVKKDEIAKHNKVIRMIGDLGVAASLQGFRLTEFLKAFMAAEPIQHLSGELEFIKTPNYHSLKRCFDQIISPRGLFYFAYFSDDSCLAFHHHGKVYRFNVDISKCDASHGEGTFSSLLAYTPVEFRDDMERLLNQLRLPIRMQTSVKGEKQKIKGFFDGTRLFSGSTLTTVVNNIANLLIARQCALAVHYIIQRDPPETEWESIFTRFIAETGYIVTGFSEKERCHEISDVQFLKHSPTLDVNGVYQPVPNFGIFLRASGTCHGDLPGRAKDSIESRSSIFQYALLSGIYPNITAPIIDRFKDATGRPNVPDKHAIIVRNNLRYKLDPTAAPQLHFHDEDLLSRYRLCQPDFSDLHEFAALPSGTGWASAAPFVTTILSVDYSLSARVI